MQNSPTSTKRVSSEVFAACVLISLATLFSGCGGPDIHKNVTDTPDVLVRKWAFPTHLKTFDAGDRGTEYSNPLILDNTLIFGTRTVGIIALYPSLNQERWVLPIQNGVTSDLLADHGSLYFVGGDGYVYSVNVDNGRVNWRYEIRTPFASRPTVSGGRLFITTDDDTVYAFDAGTGKWLWHYRRHTAQTATILGASQPLVVGNQLLTGLSDGYLVALSVTDGQLQWEKRLHPGIKFTDVDAHPILDHGIVYIPSYDGAMYAVRLKDHEIIWRFDAGGSKTVLMEGNRIYLPSSNGSIYCLDKESGKVIWKFDLDHGVPTRLVATKRWIIAGSSYQYLYAIDKTTGKAVYRYNVGYGSGFYGAPAYDSTTRHLYMLSDAGIMYQFYARPPIRKRPHGQIDPYVFQ